MSGHKYITDPNALFVEVEDVDDEEFLKNSRSKPSHNNFGYNYGMQYKPNSNSLGFNELEQQRQTILERKCEVENRTIESSERSLRLLKESEDIGIATADELMRQREQLENSNRRLDEINSTLRFSQKHINGIKSVFGSLKNYFSGDKEHVKESSSGSNSQLNQFVEPKKKNINEMYDNHPTTQLRQLDNSQYLKPNENVSASGSKNVNMILEGHLHEMSSSITRLKGLALNLGDEIESQNDLLDNMAYKADKTELTIQKQNTSLNKLMKK